MQDRISYQQLQPEDPRDYCQHVPERLQRAGHGPHAATLGFDRWARAERNTPTGTSYGWHVAQTTCQARQRAARPAAKLDVGGVAWRAVLTLLDWKWSPQ